MRIQIVSLNYAPEPTGIGHYSAGLAQALVERGHDVTVICANPHYPQWKLYDGFGVWDWSTRCEAGVSVHRCPVYVPATVSGPTRMLHYASFAVSSLVPIITHSLKAKPDIIINVAPSLLSGPAVIVAAKMTAAKSWLHVQDFEVEAAFATGNIDGGGLLARMALWFETHVMRRFDAASSISPEMCRKIAEKGLSASAIHEFRNWAELTVNPQTETGYRALWGLQGKKVALYSGSISAKQGIEILVDVARQLAPRPDFHMVICGDGPNRAALQKLAEGLSNISFHDLQPMEKLSDLMALASVHVLPQKAGAADLVLPSKLTNMLASGRPVVAGAAPGTGLAREVEGCGIVVEPDNAVAMGDAIAQILDDADMASKCCVEARTRSELRWSKAAIIDALESRMASLIEESPG